MNITPLRHFAGIKSLFAGISSLFAGKSGPLFPAPSFARGFSDLGAGAVDLGANSTFTRATSATCWSPAGLLLTVGTGVARSTYTELTGATYLGYLSEEARTNNVIQNRDCTNAAWTNTNMTAAKDQVGIDGAANSASSLLATAGNATTAQTVTIAAVNRPFSVYVKRLVGTGNIDLAQDGASFTTQSVANDGLWHRVTLVASQLNPVLTIRLATNADKIAVDYAMLEDTGGGAATYALSPIATAGASVTRNKDVLTYPFAGNIDQTVGTGYAEVTGQNVTNPNFISSTNGTVMNANATNLLMFDGSTNFAGPAFTQTSAIQKIAGKWNVAGSLRNMYLAGVAGTPTATFDGNLSLTGALAIGSNGSSQNSNGTIKNLKIWTVALSDAQIAAL